MKTSISLLLAVVAGYATTMVSAGSIPSEEMFRAETFEEMERLRLYAESGMNDESMRAEYMQRRLLEKSQPLLASYFGGQPGFYHGVASGDPLPDAIILWTRYTPVSVTDKVLLELRISPVIPTLPVSSHLDPSLNPALRRVNVEVTSDSDWVAKIDVKQLPSGTNFIFAFSDGTRVSEIGQTKTAPPLDADVSQLVYAVFSCSHFANGYFHPYDVASTIKDLDFWMHVGDYVYEYGLYSSYASNSPERKAQILPIWEQIDLQDHRLRQATYHLDEGLRNLRRRAPLLATWDDHETTNNAYGQGLVSNTGAQNHQDVCPVNETATNSQKSSAGCDRDEGPVDLRFTAAAQAYMEWMPIRRGPGTMGVVNITSITQVIEWGKLASVVLFDTRISYRSKEPTLDSFFNVPATVSNTNVSAYTESPIKEQIEATAASIRAKIFNPNYTQIGENINLIRTVFQNSKDAGKPWQIWAGGTMMALHIAPNLNEASRLFSNATIAAAVKTFLDQVLPAVPFARILVALALTSTPWNSDDFNGFGVERAKMLEITKNNANNAIMIGGDLHDSWAWTMYEGGNKTGTPVAVNLGAPGVTSPGWGPSLFPVLQGLAPIIGGNDAVYKLINDMFYQQNPGLKYAEVQNKGFFVVKATKTTHTVEYIHNSPATILSNFATARAASGKIVADFFCGGSLVTTAGIKGSLVRQPSCSAIQFESSRSPLWTAPFPTSTTALLPTLKSCDFNACSFAQTAASTSPSVAPSSSPIKTPVKTPVSAPIPVKSPASTPTAPVPGQVPVTAPIPAPASTPASSPLSAPVRPPASVPVPASAPSAATVPVSSPASVPASTPVTAPIKAPVTTPVKAPASAPAPVKAPVPVGSNATVPVPVPVPAPVDDDCGLFGLNIFCLFSGCGFLKRLFNIGDC